MTEPLARREYLKQLSTAALATMSLGAPRLLAAPGGHKVRHPKPTADACILLWMAGGMAAPDTFDPKRYTAFKPGTKVADVLSTFPPIDSVVDGLKLTEGLEHTARVMDRATLVRSHYQPDLGHILHSRHQYHWH